VATAAGLRGALKERVGLEGRYSLWEPAYLYIHQERERAILRLLRRHGLHPLVDAKVLEIGCGTGAVLREFIRFGVQPANALGIDIDRDALAIARARNPGVDLRTADAAGLPASDGSFDLVLAFTVFTSIADANKRAAVASEVQRVLRPGGALLWYDFRVNPLNPDTQALGLAEIERLFGCEPVDSRRVTLAPPIVRALAPRSWIACELLARLPFLRTHWLALVRP
jgi:SAM-dependent methyltransferase